MAKQTTNKTWGKEVERIINQALREDAAHHDVTTNFLIPKGRIAEGYIIAREPAVVCGLEIVERVFQKLDKNILFKTKYKDGDYITEGTKIIFFKGKARALLTGERTALNFISCLSGVATNTKKFVDAIKPYKTVILNTRKTTPGLRELERYAVRSGGGVNHRANLKEMVLVKDNHIQLSPCFVSLSQAIESFKKKNKTLVEVEVDTLDQLKKVLNSNPDMIMVDNMTPLQIKQAVNILKESKLKKKPLLEASGGITLKNVRAIARTGVDRISLGSLTHTHKFCDFSMEVTN